MTSFLFDWYLLLKCAFITGFVTYTDFGISGDIEDLKAKLVVFGMWFHLTFDQQANMETEELIKLVDGIYKVSLSFKYTQTWQCRPVFAKNTPPFLSLGTHSFGQDFDEVPKPQNTFLSLIIFLALSPIIVCATFLWKVVDILALYEILSLTNADVKGFRCCFSINNYKDGNYEFCDSIFECFLSKQVVNQ